MNPRTNEFGQPIGPALPDWRERSAPPRAPMQGRYCRIEPLKHELNKEYAWDESPFRALHVCFLRRSSRQAGDGPRMNVPDRTAPRRAPVRAWRALLEAIGRPPAGTYKGLYRVGELVTVDVAPMLASTYRATASGAA